MTKIYGQNSKKMSLTGQWQYLRQSLWELVKAENHWLIILVMDIPLMDKCHWPQSMTKIYGQNFKKMSLTMVNDKKNCHWLKVFYVLVKIARQRFRKHSTFYSDACCLKWKKNGYLSKHLAVIWGLWWRTFFLIWLVNKTVGIW